MRVVSKAARDAQGRFGWRVLPERAAEAVRSGARNRRAGQIRKRRPAKKTVPPAEKTEPAGPSLSSVEVENGEK